MPDRVQDLTNHRKVAVACKNYTDKEIKASEERILSIVARNNVDFIDHINEATYRFTAPLNSKLLMLQSIAGNSVKYSPSVASDNNATHIKTLPSTVYDLDVSKVEGVGYKVNQLVGNLKATFTTGGVTFTNNGDGSMTLNGTATEEIGSVSVGVDVTANITFPRRSHKVLVTCNNTLSGFYYGVSGYSINNSGAFFFNESNPTDWTNGIGCHIVAGTVFNNFKIIPQSFDLTADFGSGNEPTSVSDCATAYLQRGINIYEYTPQQSSIKNNAFTGVKVEGENILNISDKAETTYLGLTYKIENGEISVSGTAGGSSYVFIELNIADVLPKGTYAINWFNQNIDSTVYLYTGYNGQGDYTLAKFLTSQNMTATGTLNGIDQIRMRFTSSNTYNIKFKPMIVRGSTTPTTYVPYIAPTTISVDLTTIKDSNNVSLFPSGKMMGNSSVADFITPYNQESRWDEVDLGSLEWTYETSESYQYGWFYADIIGAKAGVVGTKPNIVSAIYEIKLTANSSVAQLTTNMSCTLNNASRLVVRNDSYNNATTFKTAMSGVKLQYERATYLTSTTDLTSLTRINAQSNGTITLNNTDNVDMPNLISYNGVIKHALATAVKQDGFNVWDEEIEIGAINSTTGQKENNPSGNYWRSKNYFEVIANQTYFVKQTDGYTTSNANMSIYFYEDNYNYISRVQNVANTTVVIPSNCKYIMFQQFFINATQTTPKGICINISNQDLNGTYKPYKAPITRLLPNSEAKYSWGITTGVRNVRTYCDDEGNAVNEGSLVVGNNDLGSDTWNRYQGNGGRYYFKTSISGKKTSDLGDTNLLCAKYETKPTIQYEAPITTTYGDKVIVSGYNNQAVIALDDVISTADIFATANDGVPLFYEKNATDTETLDDFDYFFDCEEGDTFTLVNSENLQCYATYSFLIKEAKSNE